MNIISRVCSKPGSFIGKLLSASLSVWMLGVAFSPALAAVTVDQAPLIIQKPLPPNITLMLDDSGSMEWDYMPDWDYLSDTSDDGVRDSDINGTYYNPDITYTVPPKANGIDNYPDSPSLSGAYNDGFSDQGTLVDVRSYSSPGYNNSDSSKFPYYTMLASTVKSTYSPSCDNGDDFISSGSKVGQCEHYSRRNGYSYYSACNGSDAYNSTSNKCETYTQKLFTYTTKSAGAYVRHYVGVTGDCATLSSATDKAACDDSAKTQQNVANWFSYYRNRMLMAKSGVMSSFANIDPTYRIGFGSIGGSNTAALGTADTDYYPFDTQVGGSTYHTGVAHVEAFGSGADNTQKKKLWDWLVGTSPKSSTPLRGALNAVGKYYQTDQPWQTSDSDTTELACRQSYTILTTDGFWNGSTPDNIGDVDGTATSKAITGPENSPYLYTPAMPYADGTITSSSGYVDASCPSYKWKLNESTGMCTRKGYDSVSACNSGDTYDSANPGKDRCIHVTVTGGNSDTLADVAMKYWLTDLRPNTVNEVPKSIEDEAFWQHMTTFTLGLGFLPVYKEGGAQLPATSDIFAWAQGGAAIDGFTSWPKPGSDDIENIADLEHAGVNGHGGFYSATSPDAFTAGLKDALKRASSRVGTGASLAANSTELKTGTFAYQANYHTAKWTGDLKAIAVDPDDGSLSTTITWSAADPTVLPAFGSRKIYTYNPDVSPAAAVAFTDPSTLSAKEQAALGTTAADQLNMINYLRGDNSLEQSPNKGPFRTRETPLGDIVDSQPVYVGQPDPNVFTGETFAGSSAFAAYASTARTGQIFVAANDGMLHVFDADTGVEDYAYLPAAVITSGLKNLADPDYGTTVAMPHQYFNDGELTVADVYYSSAWHAIAVGTTGRGLAKAIYALDVTTSTPKFLWERSAGDTKGNQDYIGQMTGKPIIAQTADGVWSVLMGNGYNSKNGVAALLQFDIEDGTLTVHKTDTSTGNGLAAPAVWLGDLTNGISTIAYAGDALGQVWSFGLNDGSAATPSSDGTKLFTTKIGTVVQPITSGMLAGKDPATGNLWVFFGTGQYLSTGDLSSTATQSWYGLIVKSDTDDLAVDSGKDRGDLVQRSIIAETPGTAAVVADPTANPPVEAQDAIAPARAVTLAAGATSMTGKSGWYIDLLSPSSTTSTAPDPDDAAKTITITTYTPNAISEGERIVTPNQFQGNQLLATTRIPQATDLCNPSGRGWIMSVDPFTGTSPQSSFFDLNGDGLINSPADTISVGGVEVPASGIGFSSLPNNPIFVGGNMLVSFDNGNATSIKTSGSGGIPKRVSWRELINQ